MCESPISIAGLADNLIPVKAKIRKSIGEVERRPHKNSVCLQQ